LASRRFGWPLLSSLLVNGLKARVLMASDGS